MYLLSGNTNNEVDRRGLHHPLWQLMPQLLYDFFRARTLSCNDLLATIFNQRERQKSCRSHNRSLDLPLAGTYFAARHFAFKHLIVYPAVPKFPQNDD
jgi:hypothetical protein